MRGGVRYVMAGRVMAPVGGVLVGLGRCVEGQTSAGSMVEDTPVRIARAVSRSGRQREVPARTMLCLKVMEERGLIHLNYRTDRLQITLRPVERKVDLEDSALLKRLRQALEEGSSTESSFS